MDIQPDDLELAETLLRQLNEQCPDLGATSVRALAVGLENRIFHASCCAGEFALKVPLTRLIENDNDRDLDARDLLRQEFHLQGYLRDNGFPVPERRTLLLADAPHRHDVLVYRLVESDGSPPTMRSFGALMRRLHCLPPPAIDLVAQRSRPCEQTVCELTIARLSTVMRLSGQAFPLPSADRLLAHLRRAERKRCLLHMDARPANLLTRGGEIVALLDWSNCLIGPPSLEFCRIAEYEFLVDDFLHGYAANPLADIPRGTELALRCYTAAMLAVVFLSEAPDPVRGAAAAARAAELADALSYADVG